MKDRVLKYGSTEPGLGEKATLADPSVVDDLVKNRDKKLDEKKATVAEILNIIDFFEEELERLRKIVEEMEKNGNNKHIPPKSGRGSGLGRGESAVFKYGPIKPRIQGEK
jgi:hypothetical protein